MGPAVTTVWWDVGGVLLTDGWDAAARRAAAASFHLDAARFEARHQSVAQEFECGRLSLSGYLSCAVFDEARDFTRESFVRFMYSRSKPYRDALRVLEQARRGPARRMVMFNNESRELNRYRIDRFKLAPYFDVVCSSCFLGVRKPDERMYHMALDLLQAEPEDCVLIDDRDTNLEPAATLGLRTLHYRTAAGLARALARLGLLP